MDVPVRYIAIEGVIGAGKTTLASLLAQSLPHTRLVVEQFEDNPFLEDFYNDRGRYALQVQLFFLLSRYRQQRELMQSQQHGTTLISDYTLHKDEIFARLILGDTEFSLYQQVAHSLQTTILQPDVVVYLHSSVEQLVANIAHRARPYERAIDQEYIEQLHRAYHQFFASYTAAPVLTIHTAHLDVIGNPHHFAAVRSFMLTPISNNSPRSFSVEDIGRADGGTMDKREK